MDHDGEKKRVTNISSSICCVAHNWPWQRCGRMLKWWMDGNQLLVVVKNRWSKIECWDGGDFLIFEDKYIWKPCQENILKLWIVWRPDRNTWLHLGCGTPTKSKVYCWSMSRWKAETTCSKLCVCTDETMNCQSFTEPKSAVDKTGAKSCICVCVCCLYLRENIHT